MGDCGQEVHELLTSWGALEGRATLDSRGSAFLRDQQED